MAELGDMASLLGQSSTAPVEITIEMLDYTYIEECDDVDKLRGILDKLKTNEYGSYPQVRTPLPFISLDYPAKKSSPRHQLVLTAMFSNHYSQCTA
jgi:hypothetical protein